MKNIITLLLISITIFLFGQKEPAVKKIVSSVDIINEAVELYKNGDTLAYLDLLEKINPADTLGEAVYTSVVSDAATIGQYDRAMKHCNNFIENFYYLENIHKFYQSKAYILVEQKKYEEAVTFIDKECLSKYPNYAPFWFLKVKALYGQEKYEAAENIENQLIENNPYYYFSHFLISSKYISSDLVSQASITALMAALVNPTSSNELFYLKSLNNYLINKQEPTEILKLKDAEKFSKVDVFLKNKLALDEGYETPSKINDGYLKQLHFLLTNIEKMDASSFENLAFKKFYIPFFKKLMKDGMFEEMTYYLYSDKDVFPKVAPLYQKETTIFRNWLETTISDLCSTEFAESGVKKLFSGKTSSGLLYLGKIKDNSLSGKFSYFLDNGNLTLEGELSSKGLKVGTWKWYHTNGKVYKTIDYKNNLISGKLKTWDTTGAITLEADYVNDLKSGSYVDYYLKDVIQSSASYKNGDASGLVRNYYINGQLLSTFEMKNGKVVGEFLSFHENGDTSAIKYYSKEGLLEGKAISYYPGHRLDFSGIYSENYFNGTCKWYYPNGKLKEEKTYEAGKIVGESKEYYSNGKMESAGTYNSSNNLEGPYKYYDKNGTLIHSINYKNGKIMSFENYGKNGEVTSTGEKEGSNVNFVFQSAYGLTQSEGKYNRKDGKEGLWVYYYGNGSKMKEENYLDSQLDGMVKIYYPDGTFKAIENYSMGYLDGYYANFYSNGVLRDEGWYEMGYQVGPRYLYFPDGETLKEEYYYVDGDKHGENIEYYFNGNKRISYQYQYDELFRIVNYDTNGVVLNYDNLTIGKDLRKSLYFNGAVKVVIPSLNGIVHGKKIFYHPNGNVDEEIPYMINKRHGEMKTYYLDGKLRSTKEYSFDEIDGHALSYFKNGKLSEDKLYEIGSLKLEINYFETGLIESVFPYDEGSIHGKVEFYSPDGVLDHLRYYDHGIVIGYSYLNKNGDTLPMISIKNETARVVSYFQNGKVSREYSLRDGNFEDEYKKYYTNGQVYYQATYLHDNVNGVQFSYSKTGQIINKIEFYNGYYHGEYKIFDANGKLSELYTYKLGELHGTYKIYENGILINEYLYNTDSLVKIIKQ